MADLVTHACVATLARLPFGVDRPRLFVFVAGSLLPDLLGRGPELVFTQLYVLVPAIPVWTSQVFGPLHLPVGILITSALLAPRFARPPPPVAFGELMLGGLLHLGLDLLQSHLGVGYILLFPFSTETWAPGRFSRDGTVPFVPLLLVLTALVWRQRPPVRAP